MASEQPITILADMRESRSPILARLNELGVQLKVGALDTGDFVLSGDMVVERKTAADFVASIQDGRLFNQIGKMKVSFARPIVLIEGDPYSTRSAIAREAIDGALSFMVAIEGVSVLYVRNPTAAADLIYRMATRAQQGLGYEVAFRRGKVTPGKQAALFCIEGIVSVGPSTAAKALAHFKSIQAFMNASVQQLMEGKRPALPPVTRSVRAASCAFSGGSVIWNRCQCGARRGSRMFSLGATATSLRPVIAGGTRSTARPLPRGLSAATQPLHSGR